MQTNVTMLSLASLACFRVLQSYFLGSGGEFHVVVPPALSVTMLLSLSARMLQIGLRCMRRTCQGALAPLILLDLPARFQPGTSITSIDPADPRCSAACSVCGVRPPPQWFVPLLRILQGGQWVHGRLQALLDKLSQAPPGNAQAQVALARTVELLQEHIKVRCEEGGPQLLPCFL